MPASNPPDDMEWHTPAKAYLTRVCEAEYKEQRARHGRRRSKFRFCPSDYVNGLIKCLDRNDEEGFKATKLDEGYASAAGV